MIHTARTDGRSTGRRGVHSATCRALPGVAQATKKSKHTSLRAASVRLLQGHCAGMLQSDVVSKTNTVELSTAQRCGRLAGGFSPVKMRMQEFQKNLRPVQKAVLVMLWRCPLLFPMCNREHHEQPLKGRICPCGFRWRVAGLSSLFSKEQPECFLRMFP